jgi:hypothetical protein
MEIKKRDFDPVDNWDYANILFDMAEIEVTTRQHTDHSQDGKVVRGYLSRHLRGCAGVMVIGNGGEFLDVDPLIDLKPRDEFGKIKAYTRDAIYDLVLDDPYWMHRKSSLLYMRRGYLDWNDRMEDGFFDGGRHLKFKLDQKGKIIFGKGPREVIIYDRNQDQILAKQLEYIGNELASIQSMRDKVKFLALYVSGTLGGQHGNAELGPNLDRLSKDDVERVKELNEFGVKKVLIGNLNQGICPHRSGKYKYFADRCDVPCRLVKGKVIRKGHAWNVVTYDGEYYLEDVLLSPGSSIKTTEEFVDLGYKRQGIDKRFAGGVGGKTVGIHFGDDDDDDDDDD